MDSANSTIPLRGLQYIASPEPSTFACRNRLNQKVNMTNISVNEDDDKYNTTLPVLNSTQCHGTKSSECREKMCSAKCKERCSMTKEKEGNLCTVGDDNHVFRANKSTETSSFANSKEFAETLSRFSYSTRQMLNLNESHNKNTLNQSLPLKTKCYCSNNISDTELHILSAKKANSKVNCTENNKEDTALTNNMKGTQYKNNTMPIVTKKTDMHSNSLSMSNAMKTLPLRQTCRDYCFTSLSTILSRQYATPSHHYLCSNTIGQKQQRKINVCKDNNNNNNKNNADNIVDDNNTNNLSKDNNVDTQFTHRYNNTIGTSKQFESTLMRKAGNVPPLVITLRSHIQRELDCIAHRKFNRDKVTSASGVVNQENTNMDSGNRYTTEAGQSMYRVADDQNGSLHHEMSDNKCLEMCVVDQLLPYREALVALRSALPGYEQLLEEIQVAYDKVIEAQAELLTDAYAKEAIKEFTSEEQREEALRLRQQVNDLTTTLNKMRVELEARRRLAAEAEDEDGDEYDGSASNNVNNNGVNYSSSTSAVVGSVALKKGVNRSRSALAKARSDFFEATQKLQLAQQRITKLEQNSKGDLEKILVLIGAVRECDRRLKSYEQTVKTMSGQIEELDEFKRLAAEAQAELQRYKERYECFVALGDFELMRQHLTDELASSQAMSRRLRRTAAVRGTQVEVMQRRLNTLEEELTALRSNGVNLTMQEMTLASTTEKRLSSTQLLTPRPNWAAVHRKMHEMAEETKPIFCFPLPHISETNKPKEESVLPNNVNNMPHGTAHNDTTTAIKNNNDIHTSDTDTSQKQETLPIKNDEKGTNAEDDELLVIDAAKETSSQVDLLVDHIIHLQHQLEQLSSCNTFYQMCMQKWLALPERLSTLPVDKVGKNNGIANSLHSHRSYGHEPSPDTTTTTATTAIAAAVTTKVNNILPATPENMKNAFNLLEPEFANFELSKRLESMQSAWILGPGVESQIPAYLRVSGCVERIVVAPKTRCRLIFNFFTEILQPLFSEPYNSKSALAELFATFLESQIEEEDSLTQFACNAHLALNLEMDCHTPSLNNPPLLLLFNILNYRMPVRLAIDAVEVVSHAMSDITALAKEQRKARLRRGAISECLTLLLELMTTNEIAELRIALGEELTFDAVALASIDSRFMRTLFYQSCQSSMDLYTNLIQKLTLRSSTVVNEEHIRNQVISTRDVAEIILAVEARTPEIVIRELTENALKSCMQSDETTANDDVLTSTLETNLYLNEVIKAVGEAPIIRRSAQSLKDDCNL